MQAEKTPLSASWWATQPRAALREAGTTTARFGLSSLKRRAAHPPLPCGDFGEDRLALRGVRRRSNPQSRKRGPERAERVEVSVTCSDSLPNFAATFTVGEGL